MLGGDIPAPMPITVAMEEGQKLHYFMLHMIDYKTKQCNRYNMHIIVY